MSQFHSKVSGFYPFQNAHFFSEIWRKRQMGSSFICTIVFFTEKKKQLFGAKNVDKSSA